MTCDKNSINSNVTGLRVAEEKCLKELPGSPVWRPMEPNSYDDLGGSITTKAREPITDTRQRKKGSITDLDASGGWNQDLTAENLNWLMQGFVFADAIQKATTAPLKGGGDPVTAVNASKKYTTAAGAQFGAGDIVVASGFAEAGNNGMKTVTAATGADITVDETTVAEGSPGADAKLEAVGFKFTSAGDAKLAFNAGVLSLTATTADLTDIGLMPGQWVYLGGDGSDSRFDKFNGFARAESITAGTIVFDKVDWAAPEADSGTGKNIELYYGMVIQNAANPDDIVQRSYQLERTLGKDDNGTMSQYVLGATPNEMTVNIPGQDLCNVDLAFQGADAEVRDGTKGVKSGSRPDLDSLAAINTSNDFSRVKLAKVGDNSSIKALFAFSQELNLSITNNVEADKAIGVLGAIGLGAGMFDVSGLITAYFATVDAIEAVRNNASLTLDVVAVKDNKAVVMDVPHLTVSNGLPAVSGGDPITIPLDINGVESKFGTTFSWQAFPYIPNIAGE